MDNVKITYSQLKYLHYINTLSQKGEVSITELSNYMGVSKVSACRAVDKLILKNYAKKDEKRKIILTEYGYDLYKYFKQCADYIAERLVESLKCSSGLAKVDSFNIVCAMSKNNLEKLYEMFVKKEEKICR